MTDLLVYTLGKMAIRTARGVGRHWATRSHRRVPARILITGADRPLAQAMLAKKLRRRALLTPTAGRRRRGRRREAFDFSCWRRGVERLRGTRRRVSGTPKRGGGAWALMVGGGFCPMSICTRAVVVGTMADSRREAKRRDYSINGWHCACWSSRAASGVRRNYNAVVSSPSSVSISSPTGATVRCEGSLPNNAPRQNARLP